MTILCRPRPRDCSAMFLKTWPAARPSLRAVSAVTGSILAVPRTPSVPKIFLGELIWLCSFQPQINTGINRKERKEHTENEFFRNEKDPRYAEQIPLLISPSL